MVGNRDIRLRVRRFRSTALVTIVAVYFLILVGGIVRATGSGMGCPDWPKCFDSWVPPTRESQLPVDYQAIYAERGYRDVRFNPVKTWTEYVNRLMGVSIGLFIFMTLLQSFRVRQVSGSIPLACLAAILLVAVEGWLGSVLIETNLAGWAVTIHMLLALVIVGLLIFVVVRCRPVSYGISGLLATARLSPLFAAVLFLTLVQIVLGTQVREHVDVVASTLGDDRGAWIAKLGWTFLVHRSFSIALICANLLLVYRINRATLSHGLLPSVGKVLLFVLALEVAAGAGLSYLEVPPILQPVHLLLAAVVAGLQFGMWSIFRFERAA